MRLRSVAEAHLTLWGNGLQSLHSGPAEASSPRGCEVQIVPGDVPKAPSSLRHLVHEEPKEQFGP